LEAARPRIIVTFLGNPLFRTDGCHIRVLEMLRFLVESGFDVTFYSFRNYPVWQWSDAHIEEFQRTFPEIVLILDHWGPLANSIRC